MSTTITVAFEPIQQMLTIRQAAQSLQLSERTVASMVASGTLASVKIGSARRIAADALRSVAKTGSDTGRQG
jgi:excisionase family DNA binding protein